MENNKFTNQSLEELHAKYTNAKKVFIILGIFILMANFGLVMMIFKTELYSLFAVMIGSMLTLMPLYVNQKQLKEELKSRQS